jgi:hypothetical protein
MNRQEKLNFILKNAGKCKMINECEEAIIGYVELPNNSIRVAYNKKEVINLLVRTKKLTEIEAIEYYYEKYLKLKIRFFLIFVFCNLFKFREKKFKRTHFWRKAR